MCQITVSYWRINGNLRYIAQRNPDVAKRTYPEVYLSSRFNRALEDDYAKVLRVAEYIVGCGDKHGLILAPKSLQLGRLKVRYNAEI